MSLLGSREHPLPVDIPSDPAEGYRVNYGSWPYHEALDVWLAQRGRERIRELYLSAAAFKYFAQCLGSHVGTVYPAQRFAIEWIGPNGPVWVKAAV